MIPSIRAGAAALLLLGACAHRPLATSQPGRDEEPIPRCPMSVAGTWLAAADSHLGAVLTFTTTGSVAALRGRVHYMAELHNLRHARATRSAVTAAASGPRPVWPWTGAAVPPSYATVVEIERGAVLEVTPTDPDDVEQLQYALRVRAWRLQHRGCGAASRSRGG